MKQEQEESEEELSDTDDESVASSGAESDAKESSWSFSNTRIGNFFTAVSGNKILTREDLEPVVEPMHNLVCFISLNRYSYMGWATLC